MLCGWGCSVSCSLKSEAVGFPSARGCRHSAGVVPAKRYYQRCVVILLLQLYKVHSFGLWHNAGVDGLVPYCFSGCWYMLVWVSMFVLLQVHFMQAA